MCETAWSVRGGGAKGNPVVGIFIGIHVWGQKATPVPVPMLVGSAFEPSGLAPFLSVLSVPGPVRLKNRTANTVRLSVGRSPIVIVIEVATEAGANFSQIKQAPGGVGRFPCLLDGWRQDRRQDSNDGYDYQKLDKGKALAPIEKLAGGEAVAVRTCKDPTPGKIIFPDTVH